MRVEKRAEEELWEVTHLGTNNKKAYISTETNEGDESVGDIKNKISHQYQRQQRILKT